MTAHDCFCKLTPDEQRERFDALARDALNRLVADEHMNTWHLLVEARKRVEEPPIERLYTLSEAAALVGVSRSTIYRWIKAGHIKPVTIPVNGGTYRIPASQLEEVAS